MSDYFVKGSEIGLFAQDKWKVNGRFTASLGLRWDVEDVQLDNTGNFLFSDPSHSPVDKNNLSPRVGGTYTLDDRGTAVIRGGYGLYFQKTSYSNFTPIASSGVTSTSFTVSFPTNNIDPGPSAGRLPTEPFLVNGPVVNRALLNQLYPAGTTTKNTGTVRFDSPDRHLPFSHQASIGIEKQLAGNIAVSADYVHASHRDLYMLQELNPGIRATTGPDGSGRADIPDHAVQRRSAGARQRGHVRVQRPAGQHPEALQQPLPGPYVVHLFARPRHHEGARRHRFDHDLHDRSDQRS